MAANAGNVTGLICVRFSAETGPDGVLPGECHFPLLMGDPDRPLLGVTGTVK